MLKTHACGLLRLRDAGEYVVLAGWVHRRRDHGGIIFLDLRDREGIVQVVIDSAKAPEAHKVANEVRPEYVIQVRGKVEPRPQGFENPDLPTGDVEVHVEDVKILSASRTPPFQINEDIPVDEALRLRYRYLDLRRQRMQRNLGLRHRSIMHMREFLDKRGFWEIETPILIKSTPEGARDFVVPSRLHPGKFYALPQSPQQLKQLLMVAGYEKYFQIARCFRDEDLRADRQPEFTQLDLEMSFVEPEDVQSLIEELLTEQVEKLTGKTVWKKPFPRITYDEAMAKYGSDKPDLRFGLEFVDFTKTLENSSFRVFSSTIANGGQVKGINVPGGAEFSRKKIDELTDFAKQYEAKGLVWIARQRGQNEDGTPKIRSSVSKHLSKEEIAAMFQLADVKEGDLLLIVADQPKVVAASLGNLRLRLGRELGLMDDDVMALAWIVDFPLLEWSEEENRWKAMHHPFTSAVDEDWDKLETDPGSVRAKAYDAVCNGAEIAGGSIRIHRPDLQSRMFRALGISEEEAKAQFGHLLEAFTYGVPPHGGIAVGIDRWVAMLASEKSIREVIAFPKTAQGVDLMVQAPSPITDEQLRELHLKVVD